MGYFATGLIMKFAADRPYADPEAAARKLIEIANSVEPVQDGRIHIELINGPMLFEHKATPAEYSAGLELAIRARLDRDARERDLREIYPGRRGAVRLKQATNCSQSGYLRILASHIDAAAASALC